MKLLLLLVLTFVPLASAQLKIGFYNWSCPKAESIVRGVVAKLFEDDPSITAGLLCLYFHDCFPNGCDASLLINSPPANSTEKRAGPNRSVRGYGIIDEAKSALECQCPSIVSCADVIALATRDAVALAGGPNYAVPTGRRDGTPSDTSESHPSSPAILRPKELPPEETVVLLGAHTVGFVQCGFINSRNAAMDRRLHANLTKDCADKGFTFLDHDTPFAVDNKFYTEILAHRGMLAIDQQLAVDNTTAPIVQRLASDPKGFLTKFASALVKMGSLNVLVGTQGDIRNKCTVPNWQ